MSNTKKPGGPGHPTPIAYESQVIVKVAAGLLKKPAANAPTFVN